MKTSICFITTVLTMFLLPAKGLALENQQDETFFLKACNAFLETPNTVEAMPCSQYIHGFLAGARIVDSLFIDHLEEEHNKPLSFSERAFRTRVGRPESADLSLPSAPFCLPDSEFNRDIMTRLSSYMPDSVKSLDEMDKKLSEALSLEYPCK